MNEVHHGDGAPHAKETINIPHEYTTFFDMEMKDFDGSTIVIDTKYDPPKKEIDEWKETALKSYYNIIMVTNIIIKITIKPIIYFNAILFSLLYL